MSELQDAKDIQIVAIRRAWEVLNNFEQEDLLTFNSTKVRDELGSILEAHVRRQLELGPRSRIETEEVIISTGLKRPGFQS